VEEVVGIKGDTFLLGLLFFSSSFLLAAPRKAKAIYCTQAADGGWGLQRFRPLINPEAKTVFAEMSYTGPVLETVRLRRFHPGYEVVFEYKFDAAGKLSALLGSVEAWEGHWVAEANLYPEADGTLGTIHLKYYRSQEHDQISRPEDAQHYTGELSKVPIYRTTESLPCGGLLKEAEKMNATQE
jgi:hypothetical protein